MSKSRIAHLLATYLHFIFAMLIAGAWFTCDYINVEIMKLPVYVIPKVKPVVSEFDIKALYPVRTVGPGSGLKTEPGAAIDFVFSKDVAAAPVLSSGTGLLPPPVAVVPFDAPMYLKSVVTVDAIAPGGVFINKRYRKVGDRLEELSVPNEVGSVVPLLYQTRAKEIVLKVGEKLISVPIPS